MMIIGFLDHEFYETQNHNFELKNSTTTQHCFNQNCESQWNSLTSLDNLNLR